MSYDFRIDHRYLNGKIYRVYSKRLPNLWYVGSTVNNLRYRLSGHRTGTTNDYMTKLFQKFDDVVIELIEDYPCFNKTQLCQREQHHIDKAKKQHGVVLNKATACAWSRRLLPKPIVEWYMEQHPEYSTQVQLILLRDYDIDDSVNKLLDKLLTPRR